MPLKIKFYKARVLFCLYIFKFLSAILAIEKPPIVSAAAIIQKDGKLLFQELSYMKGLGLPGGIIQGNETAEEAVTREVKEETGLDVTHVSYFSSDQALFRGYPTLNIVFLAETTGETHESIEGKLVWLKPEEATGKMAYVVSEKALQRFIKTI